MFGAIPLGANAITTYQEPSMTAGNTGGGFLDGFLDVLSTGAQSYFDFETLKFQRDLKLRELELQNRTEQSAQDPASTAAQQYGFFSQIDPVYVVLGLLVLVALYFMFKK